MLIIQVKNSSSHPFCKAL